MYTHTHARMVFHNLPTLDLARGRLKYNCGNIGFIEPLFQLRSLRPKTEKYLNLAMATGVVKLAIGRIGMHNVHPKGSMSFALKLGQNWQE